MAEVKVLYDREGKTLSVWFEDATEESVCEETGDEIIFIKGASGRVIGFEKLNFSVDEKLSKEEWLIGQITPVEGKVDGKVAVTEKFRPYLDITKM